MRDSYEDCVSPAYEDGLPIDVGALVLIPDPDAEFDRAWTGLVVADCRDGSWLVDVGGLYVRRVQSGEIAEVIDYDPWRNYDA